MSDLDPHTAEADLAGLPDTFLLRVLALGMNTGTRFLSLVVDTFIEAGL